MSDYDTPDTTESELLMPDGATRLPSGGWAVLKPFEQLNGIDVRRIRAALNREGTGEIMGGALAIGIGAVVMDWQVPGRDRLALPHNNAKVLDALPMLDLLHLEDQVRPIVERIMGKESKAGEADPS